MKTIKLLLIEDDGDLGYIIKNCLEDVIGGYECFACRKTFRMHPVAPTLDVAGRHSHQVKHVHHSDSVEIYG